ncbi:reverse transcriptase-like protein [bacterium]|nr:reverse transcriptase-like protein [bacterium]
MTFTINTDGGARNNPGPAGIGAVFVRDGQVLHELSEYIGEQTNNVAEYTAVIRALEICKEREWFEELSFRLDSRLVVEQVQGNWKIKEPTLKPLVLRVRELAAFFPSVSFSHIPREENARADRLVNEAIDKAGY